MTVRRNDTRLPGLQASIEADVGDTLVVELANALPEPTSIHWHGLRVPAEMDGTQLVQQPIQPGETFQYRFVLPDPGDGLQITGPAHRTRPAGNCRDNCSLAVA
jgi:FtsP/CotA-like multicopper oxidase with cupredoxin domain